MRPLLLSGLHALTLFATLLVPAHAQGTPESLVEAFLEANRRGDVETMVMLALPQHEPSIRSPRWQEFWRGFVVRRYLGTRLTAAQGSGQPAEVRVALEYSADLLAKLQAHYEGLPPGHTRELTRQTLERRGQRIATIRVVRLGGSWYWDHE